MGGGGGGNTTTRTEPPEFIRPYLQYGAQQAQGQYQGGGTPVVPFAPQTEQALALQQARATSGSPVNTAASGYTADVLGGKYLSGNPYADSMFNKAALATQNQLASQFAGSGRDITASAPARADQLNDLANQFYYQNYNDERSRQQGLVPYAGQVANQDYTDINQLGAVGGQVEQLAQQYANQPSNSLDQYLQRVTGAYPGGTQTTRQPSYNNAGNLALAGGALAAGELTGSSLLPLLLLSDRRAKCDIKRIGVTNGGLGVYTFRYLNDDTIRMGVMADETAVLYPEAVHIGMDGYTRVNYGAIG